MPLGEVDLSESAASICVVVVVGVVKDSSHAYRGPAHLRGGLHVHHCDPSKPIHGQGLTQINLLEPWALTQNDSQGGTLEMPCAEKVDML